MVLLLEAGSETSLLWYFKEEGLSLCPVARTTRLRSMAVRARAYLKIERAAFKFAFGLI